MRKLIGSAATNFLDKELEKISRNGPLGRRLADKLVKVYLLDGAETWVLIHIEVQGHQDLAFEERMFIYYYRIFDRYHRGVSSLAILTDKNESYRPNIYQKARWETEVLFKFPAIKILDYNKAWAELEANPNPFAVVVMAQLKWLELNRPNDLKDWKVRLIKMLFQRGYSRNDVQQLFRFIDWIIKLPENLELKFMEEIAKEEPKDMPYITSIERIGEKRGRKESLVEIVLGRLKRRFKEIEPELEQHVETLTIEQLTALEVLLDTATLDEVKNWLKAQKT